MRHKCSIYEVLPRVKHLKLLLCHVNYPLDLLESAPAILICIGIECIYKILHLLHYIFKMHLFIIVKIFQGQYKKNHTTIHRDRWMDEWILFL